MSIAAESHFRGSSALLKVDRPETRLATRLSFLVAGFGVASWAPLVPFAKERLHADDGTVGLMLLCLGVGSVALMFLTGVLNARYGSRPIVLAGGFGLAVLLPLLAVAGSPVALGMALFGFGAALGALDVAMNIHAVEVERAAGRPLMSGFHALFSVGGFAGATLMTFLLSSHLGPFASTLLAALPMAITMAVAAPRLLRASHSQESPLFVAPHGIVLLLAALAAVMFLVEGAILDWSALLVTEKGLVREAQGGLGYSIFAIAMTSGRLGGDFVTARVGDRAVLFWGGLATMAGFAVLLAAPIPAVAMSGFLLIGLGASNIVPVVFRGAGAQRAMPAGHAVAAITTAGYSGILVGPAGIGFVARTFGLSAAFWLLAALVGAVVLSAGSVTAQRTRKETCDAN
jgi:predicted MFS family arabinose efflux permease